MHKLSTLFITQLFLLALFGLSACDNKPTKAAKLAADTLSVVNHTIRAMPPGQTVTALFMTLHNPSLDNYALIGVESDVCETIELHQHKDSDGMMQMSQVDKIDIKAQGNTALKSGGYHIMLIGLKEDLKLDQKVDLKLIFKDKSSMMIQSVVQKIKTEH